MIKLVSLIERREGMSFADFDAHWEHTHAAHALAIPGVLGYIQNPVDQDVPRECAFDGVAEEWLVDPFADHAVAAALGVPVAEDHLALAEDEDAFLAGERLVLCEQHVVVPRPSPALRARTMFVVVCGARRRMLDHVDELRATPGVVGAIVNVVIEYDDLQFPFDGLTQLWWAGEESPRPIFPTDACEHYEWAFCRERVVVAPPE